MGILVRDYLRDDIIQHFVQEWYSWQQKPTFPQVIVINPANLKGVHIVIFRKKLTLTSKNPYIGVIASARGSDHHPCFSRPRCNSWYLCSGSSYTDCSGCLSKSIACPLTKGSSWFWTRTGPFCHRASGKPSGQPWIDSFQRRGLRIFCCALGIPFWQPAWGIFLLLSGGGSRIRPSWVNLLCRVQVFLL